jgi:hypothetical protein
MTILLEGANRASDSRSPKNCPPRTRSRTSEPRLRLGVRRCCAAFVSQLWCRLRIKPPVRTTAWQRVNSIKNIIHIIATPRPFWQNSNVLAQNHRSQYQKYSKYPSHHVPRRGRNTPCRRHTKYWRQCLLALTHHAPRTTHHVHKTVPFLCQNCAKNKNFGSHPIRSGASVKTPTALAYLTI